jgi:ABC-2 type transport system ATP-binding protein
VNQKISIKGMSVQVKNVSKFYGQQKALDQVSFEADKGQVMGFLGPNGAGKSTMMKIITCYLPQSEGEVKVCGFNVAEDPIEVKKRVGYLPEHNPLYLEMYIREYLEFIGGLHGLKNDLQERVKRMLNVTGLEREQHKKIGQLSKGYRQRVGLAQAMIHDPEVLILDEPTSGLDPNQLVEIRNLIQTIGKEKTVILSTHIMQEVEAICNRVIIINQGKIVADQDTQLLRRSTSQEQLILIEFDKAVDKNLLAGLPGVLDVQLDGGHRWKVRTAGKTDLRPVLFHFAVEHGMAVLSMQVSEQNLEEVFRKLTR